MGSVSVSDSVYVPSAKPAELIVIAMGLQEGAGPLEQVVKLPIDPVNQEAEELIDRFSEPLPILNALTVCAGALAPFPT